MPSPKIAFILPVYGQFGYARKAAYTFFQHSPPDAQLIFMDDASPGFAELNLDEFFVGMPRDRVELFHFERNGGLTRSWNHGLDLARQREAAYAIAGNSDILFTPNWYDALVHAVDNGWDLVGPVTNCPGATNTGRQSVRNFYPGYKVTDDPAYLARVAARCKAKHPPGKVIEYRINGFFLFAKVNTWFAGAFDPKHVFNPANKMIKNEDELQARWLRAGRKIGYAPGSFIFHYRAVTRGKKHLHQGWFRSADPNSLPQQ